MKEFKFYDIQKTTPQNDDAILNDRDELVIKEKDPVEQFIKATALGMSFTNACKYAKLLPSEIKKWIDEGDKMLLEDPYNKNKTWDIKKVAFVERYHRALAYFEGQTLETIINAAKNGNWNAAAWLLERRLPDVYSTKVDVKVGSEGLVIKMDVPPSDKK